ncbi:MAG: outer membrane protein assembly factor BamA [Candidatus Omnitrophota bacterium]
MKISLMLIDRHTPQPYNHMMKKFFVFNILALSLFLLVPFACAQENPEEVISLKQNKVVKAIEIKGNKTIGISTILAKVRTRVGDEYLQSIISDDLKRLYNMGYFADVSVDREDYDGGFKVIFYLKEKPIVEKITFTRLNYFSPRKLLLKIQTQEGKFLDQKVLKDDVDVIRELYTKKGLTNISVDVQTDIDEATNKANLHFVIREGTRVRIRRIHIEGNSHFPNKRILKIIKARAKSIWTFTPGYLKEDVLDEDIERINSFYEREGFIDAKSQYSIAEDREGQLVVTIQIDEGKRYYVGKIFIEENSVLTESEILATMAEIKVGKVFSRERLAVDIDAIQSLYFDRGYIFANVRESTSLDSETGEVAITLNVYEGDLAYINKITIQGNTRTRDIVIRRELRMTPGEQFDGIKLKRSKERLRNLGYFEDIGYDVEDTDVSNKKDLVVQVKEAKTGSFSFGGGFSTVDQIVGFVEVEQKNFDFANWPTFTGGGQDLSLRFEAGSLRNNARLSFTEPWIFDYPISGGFDAYRTERLKERDVGYGYDEQRTGGNIRFGKEFSEYIYGGISYRREQVRIDNLDTDVSADLAREAGTNTLSMATLRSSYDSRDNAFSTKKGLVLTGIVDVAGGFLGGDKDFYRIQNRASYYVPLKFNSVIEFRLQTGLANAYDDTEVVPIFERFFAGGSSTIRGYNERKVGPLDLITEDPVGGEGMLVGNIEYTIPLVDFIKLAVFLDTGNVWAKLEDFGSGSFKSGTGLGLRIKTPIGPVSLDYGYPLSDEPGEEDRTGKFYFNISRGF